ncbi:MAG TPA: hypothetical protein VIS74_03015, partial [Chthoniobacterales bacterium]
MNPVPLCLLLLVISVLPLRAADTAYEALSVVRNKLTADGLKNVIEVKGERGADQPPAWTILMNDSSARGGIRELVVSKGAVVSERTPLGGFSGAG